MSSRQMMRGVTFSCVKTRLAFLQAILAWHRGSTKGSSHNVLLVQELRFEFRCLSPCRIIV